MVLPIKIIPHLKLEQLEEIYKQEKNSKQMRRYLAILWAYDTNFYPNVPRTANMLKVSEKAVYAWINKWNDDRFSRDTL